MLGIADYFWRLIPGNPILRRVVENAGKKRRDMVIRCGYLGLLVSIVLYTLWTSGDDFGNLALLAKDSALLFQDMSYLQLGLVALLSPIFSAGAITQERDSQTYDILLSTPLTNGQIVLGSLLSREFFIIALLVSGIPIFAVTQIFGGVAIGSIVFSFLIAASTAMVTGAIAMAIATFKVGTRRTIFSFYLFIIIYLVGGVLLDRVDFFHLTYIDASGNVAHTSTSILTAFHPFLAQEVIFKDKAYTPPALADLPEAYQSWPWSWLWTSPASFYISFMLILSFAMMAPSVIFLRRLAQSTTSLRSWILQKIRLSKGDRTRKPRSVWHNPIAWREAKTKASAARATFLRYGFIIAGLVGAIVLLVMHCTELTPAKYINHSYDSTNNTLYIEGSGLPEIPLAPGVEVKLDDQTATIDDLNGRYEVKNFTQDGNAIATIDLADYPRKLDSADARSWLLGLTIVEFSVILLIMSNSAASAVTREKEDGTLDLLLSTPITSRYYIWGKLRGLVAFVLPLVAVPVVSCFIFIAHDAFRWLAGRDSSFEWIVFPEALITMPAMLIIVCAFAAILGMQMSLRCRTTVRAVMSSVGIVVGACAMMGWCGYEVLTNSGSTSSDLGIAIGAFSPFTLLTILINPQQYAGNAFQHSAGINYDPGTARIVAFVVCIIALAVYALGIWSMYKAMVKNFDMTIRRQSR
jgi:ABC-type transport system involved in multi-copper enzyme maturation permease subunit